MRGRYEWGHFGVVGVKFKYETREDKYILGGTKLASIGDVLLTFAREWLALMFQADFDGYVGGDLQKWKRGTRTRVRFANAEMSKPPAHIRARCGLDYGQLRYDADAWH